MKRLTAQGFWPTFPPASFLIPPTYQATAVIRSSISDLPVIATSDVILDEVVTSLGSALPANLRKIAELRTHLEASQSEAGIQLTVSADDAGRAAAIANAWAEVAVVQVLETPAAGNVPNRYQ